MADYNDDFELSRFYDLWSGWGGGQINPRPAHQDCSSSTRLKVSSFKLQCNVTFHPLYFRRPSVVKRHQNYTTFRVQWCCLYVYIYHTQATLYAPTWKLVWNISSIVCKSHGNDIRPFYRRYPPPSSTPTIVGDTIKATSLTTRQ